MHRGRLLANVQAPHSCQRSGCTSGQWGCIPPDVGEVVRNATDDPFCEDTPDQSWRSSRLATCTFGMPLESTQAGWYVRVGFDAALAMLFITATRLKMLDKSIPFIIGHVVPVTMDRLKACPMGAFPGVVVTPGVMYIWLLGDVGSSELSAHQILPPS